jgi:ABC-type polysaccharide/polyol phosphate export permease
MISESCSLFLAGQNLYRQMQFDYSTLAYALVWRNLVAFLHNLVVYAAAVLIFSPHLVQPVIFLAIPGLFLVLLNGVWLALLLGIFCLRFRDLQQLVTNIVQIAIFVTPIFWPPDALKGMNRIVFVTLNPLYHIIEVVRAPLVGQLPSLTTYVGVVLIAIVGWTTTYFVFRYFRKRIAYWT